MNSLAGILIVLGIALLGLGVFLDWPMAVWAPLGVLAFAGAGFIMYRAQALRDAERPGSGV